MSPFQATITSLGEHLVAAIGRDALTSLSIWGDEKQSTAEVFIDLRDGSWAAESSAIDVVLDTLPLFDSDGLFVNYCFIPDSTATVERQADETASFVLA